MYKIRDSEKHVRQSLQTSMQAGDIGSLHIAKPKPQDNWTFGKDRIAQMRSREGSVSAGSRTICRECGRVIERGERRRTFAMFGRSGKRIFPDPAIHFEPCLF